MALDPDIAADDERADSADDLEKDLETLTKELAQLRSDLASVAVTVKELARKRGAELSAKTWQMIDDNPVSALFTVFGVGMALGLIMRRDCGHYYSRYQ